MTTSPSGDPDAAGGPLQPNGHQRTQRELAQLNYFNQEAFGINPIQHPEDGTVDIEYTVEENHPTRLRCPVDGAVDVWWNAGVGYTNFGAKHVQEGAAPIPRVMANAFHSCPVQRGVFQSYNFSFMEPWLGGKKPNALSFSAWRSIQSGQPKRIEGEINELRQSLEITGVQVGFGQRWKKPDDWFTMNVALSYQHFNWITTGSSSVFPTESRTTGCKFHLGAQLDFDPIYPVGIEHLPLGQSRLLTASFALTIPITST